MIKFLKILLINFLLIGTLNANPNINIENNQKKWND